MPRERLLYGPSRASVVRDVERDGAGLAVLPLDAVGNLFGEIPPDVGGDDQGAGRGQASADRLAQSPPSTGDEDAPADQGGLLRGCLLDKVAHGLSSFSRSGPAAQPGWFVSELISRGRRAGPWGQFGTSHGGRRRLRRTEAPRRAHRSGAGRGCGFP